MNFYPGPDGQPRIWYEPEEIESIAEEELKRAGVFPTPKDPVTDLEPLIEVHLKAKLDQYAELSSDVLGVTHFQTRQRVNISINRLLTEAAEETPPRPGAVGRWRATMAHEASHVILHRYLFDPILTGTTVSGSKVAKSEYDRLMRCLNSSVVPQDSTNWNRTRSTKDWREVQANMGMAALLMPRRLFSRIAHQKIDELVLTGLAKGSPSSNALCAVLSESFQVSKQATAIRLESLDIVSVP